jgi:hypothetical protein
MEPQFFNCGDNRRDASCWILHAFNGAAVLQLRRPSTSSRRAPGGRKNWLFAGNDKAGGTAALLYSLIASAERHSADPQRYLTSVLAKLPFTSEGEFDQFLPDIWKSTETAEFGKSVLT